MFEKLKEYGLYIILGLIALGALGYMYVTTSNTNKGNNFKKEIQYSFIDGIKLKDEIGYRNKTITGLITEINGKNFNGKIVDGNNIYLINQDGLLAIEDGRLSKLITQQQVRQLYYSGNPAELKLFLIPLVNSNLVDTNNLNGILELREDEINEINESGGVRDILTSMNGNSNESSGTKNIKDLSDFSRGYIGEGYFGLGLFDSEQEATDFANSYFSGAEVVQVSDNGKYGIFFEIVGGGSTANYNIDTLRCDGVTRETQNQLNTKNEQVNELLERERGYLQTISEKEQAIVEKDNERQEQVRQCLQLKQEAIEQRDAEFQEMYENKQDTLVSGTNIKTINGQDILGSGDITVGSSSASIGNIAYQEDSFTCSGQSLTCERQFTATKTGRYTFVGLTSARSGSSTGSNPGGSFAIKVNGSNVVSRGYSYAETPELIIKSFNATQGDTIKLSLNSGPGTCRSGGSCNSARVRFNGYAFFAPDN